jgi:hypothetical protein
MHLGQDANKLPPLSLGLAFVFGGYVLHLGAASGSRGRPIRFKIARNSLRGKA